MPAKRGLGKGLNSLIPEDSRSVSETKPKVVEKIVEKKVVVKEPTEIKVNINSVEPNRNQPRKVFEEDALEELAESIKEYGVLQPLLVQKRDGYYEIIAGERRWRAAKKAGIKEIPVVIRDYSEQKIVEIALIENIQREDLNPIEEAYGYKRLMERKGMTQSEVAQTVSKGRSTIANALRLLDLPEEAQQLLFEEKITAGHARAILSVPTLEGKKSLTNKLMEAFVRPKRSLVCSLVAKKRQALLLHAFLLHRASRKLREACRRSWNFLFVSKLFRERTR